MSHVVNMKMRIHDLEALRDACPDLGLEFVAGQKTYKWYGQHVGDYPLPEGFTADMLGKCDHAIRVKGAQGNTYEVGVVKSPDGNGYSLLWDFWQGGYGLQAKIGDNGDRLKQAYSVNVGMKELYRQGRRVTKTIDADGYVVLQGVA